MAEKQEICGNTAALREALEIDALTDGLTDSLCVQLARIVAKKI